MRLPVPLLRSSARLTQAREAAEQEGRLKRALELREAERLWAEQPRRFDGLRLRELLAIDPISSCWEAEIERSGQSAWVRVVRPGWRHDPLCLRILSSAATRSAAAGLHLPSWRARGECPHLLLYRSPLCLDELPAADEDHPPDEVGLARLAVRGLQHIQRCEGWGFEPWPLGPGLQLGLWASGAAVSWPGALDADPHGAPQAISELCAALCRLDPHGESGLGRLLATWSDSPPPTATDAEQLLRRTLRDSLLQARHTMIGRIGRQAWEARRLRLLRAVFALGRALPPIEGQHVLRADQGGPLVIAEVRRNELRGGVLSDALPLIWSPTAGLDPLPARALARAWGSRRPEDEPRRQALQQARGGDDARAEWLMRWLSAMARLRASRLLIERWR